MLGSGPAPGVGVRSETYVLKQQGHYYDISCLAYSPDGAYIASGAEDAKVSHKILPLSHHSPPLVLSSPRNNHWAQDMRTADGCSMTFLRETPCLFAEFGF